MSAKLKLLERKFARQNPEQAPMPEHGLGVAIEKLIADEVARRVGEAEERRSPRVREVLRQFDAPKPMPVPALPQTPKPPPVINSKVTRRDEFGRILWSDATVEGTGKVWRTEMTRDELGGVSSARTYLLTDTAAPPPELPSPRDYKPGEPR